uniref:Uncharacterized protein n=1 Tax=Caenorhabditis japonica TaxID=281687 RepID=A0A8R1IDJ1_CAEJA
MHLRFSAVLPPVHQAITANNRQVLRFVNFFPRSKQKITSGSSHDIENFGCSRSSDRLGSLKDIIDERFVRSQEGALDKHSFGTSHGSTLVKQTISSHIVAYSRGICHSFTSDCPDTIDVPQNFASTGDTPSSGMFHRATILIRKSTSFTATQHQSRCS